ncbi:TPA: hypothetical protein PXP37_002397 [Yersinia enterocolitica]|nr:hypothetical protein [Yersinia enterocolitica]HDL7779481.1 hypothetical protein [Yersinia enterocolitica]
MSDLSSILSENTSSLSYNNFENKRSEFNNAVKIKGDYIYSVMERDFSGKSSLSDLFHHLLPKLSKSDFDNYLNKADGSSRRYNLARMLVLQDSGVSKGLIFQSVENESKYSLVYSLINIGFNENEINDLFLKHDSPHEIDVKKLSRDADTLLREKAILQNLKEQSTNNTSLTETSFSKRDASGLNPPFSEEIVSSPPNQKKENSNKKTKIDIIEKNRKIARAVEDYGVSKKLARFAYNNKIVFHKSIVVLNKLIANGIGDDNLKKLVRGKFDLSMLNHAPSITNFFLEQYNYNISIEGSKANNTLTGSLIIDSNDVLSGKPRELRKKIIEFISLKKDDVGFSAVELITLVNGGVSDELLYSVAKGEVTASDAYLIHVFKVRRNEIKTICNKLRKKELSSEDIFRYARGVRQDGNTQPDINNKLASSVQDTLSGEVESERGISRINVGTNISENRSALDRQKSQIDEGMSKSFILYLNLSKETNDVIFDKMNIEGIFQNVRLKDHKKIISFLSPEHNYGLMEISNLVVLAENKASDDLLKKVANGDVLFQQAYVETQNSVIDTNIVEKRIKREIGENTEQQFIGGEMIMASPKGCQENQTFDECLDMFNNKNEIVKLVDKAVNEAAGKYKPVANNINSTVISSQKSNISSEGNFSPLTYLMSSILENSEMLCSYNSPTNSNAWASLGDMLAVS